MKLKRIMAMLLCVAMVLSTTSFNVFAEYTVDSEKLTLEETTTVPTGTNSFAYTKEVDGYVRVWGEGGGNANESFVLKLYSEDTLIATTKLNNVGGIIDGDVYVTWNFYYPESNDEYWTTTWETGHPKAGAQPTKVELYIDDTLVSTTDAKMSGADNVNPVVWEELGGVAPLLSGEGTEQAPYLINNINDLKAFRDDVNAGNTYKGKYVKLTADIDLAGEEWTPIGINSSKAENRKPFQGIFDGDNHTISNLVITGNKSDVGFFGYTTNGEVKNLVIKNAKVSGYLDVGVVAGTPYTSKYTNITVAGHVEVNGFSYVGGVGGKNAYANWKDITVNVDDTSYVKANSVATDGTAYRTYVGGVIGFMGEGTHSVENVTSNINVYGSTCDIGGIVGIAHEGNTFKNITCTANVYGDDENENEIGGIAGVWHNGGRQVIFDGCQHTGKVYIANKEVNVPISGPSYNSTGSGELKATVAKVGETFYWTLKDAITAAQNGETVMLLADVTADDTISIDKSITLDGAGYKISGKASPLVSLKSGADITIKNSTLQTTSNVVRWGYVAEGYTHTYQNCIITGGVYGIHYDGGKGKVIIDNCKIDGFNAFGGELTSVTVKDTTLEAKNSNYAGANFWGDAIVDNVTLVDNSGKEESVWLDAKKFAEINNSKVVDENNKECPLIDYVGTNNGGCAAIDATKDDSGKYTGGTFLGALPENLVAEGYMAKKNENGAYIIIPSASEVAVWSSTVGILPKMSRISIFGQTERLARIRLFAGIDDTSKYDSYGFKYSATRNGEVISGTITLEEVFTSVEFWGGTEKYIYTGEIFGANNKYVMDTSLAVPLDWTAEDISFTITPFVVYKGTEILGTSVTYTGAQLFK